VSWGPQGVARGGLRRRVPSWGPQGIHHASGAVLAQSADFNTGTTAGTAATTPAWLSAGRASVRFVQTSASSMLNGTLSSNQMAISQRGAAATRGLTIERSATNLGPARNWTGSGWNYPQDFGGGSTFSADTKVGPDGQTKAGRIQTVASASNGFGITRNGNFTWPENPSTVVYPYCWSFFAQKETVAAFRTRASPTPPFSGGLLLTDYTLTSSWSKYSWTDTASTQFLYNFTIPDSRQSLVAYDADLDFPMLEAKAVYPTTFAAAGMPRAAEWLKSNASDVVFGGRLRFTMTFSPLWSTSQIGVDGDANDDRMLFCRDATTQCRIVGKSRQIYLIVEGTPVVFPRLLSWNAGDVVALDITAGNGVAHGSVTINGVTSSLGTAGLVAQPYFRSEDAVIWWACDGTSGSFVSQLDAEIQSLKIWKVASGNPSGATFFASPTGSGDGLTRATPASLSSAQTLARASAGSTVLLRGGTYYLGSAFALTAADNGLTYQAYPGEVPILSGATKLTGSWTNTSGSIWQLAGVTGGVSQLFINGVRANPTYKVIATPSTWAITGTGFTPNAGDKTTINAFARPQDVIVYYQTTWRWGAMPTTSWDGTSITSDATAMANMQSWDGQFILNTHLVAYGNAPELLAAGGDFYWNPSSHALSYQARTTDSMGSSPLVEVGTLPAVVTISATLGAKAQNISLRGITIEGSSFVPLDPSDGQPHGYQSVAEGVYGFIGQYFTSAQGPYVLMPAMVRLSECSGITLAGCVIRRFAGAGLSLLHGAQSCLVEGCVIFDGAGNGICEGDVTSTAYQETDTRAWVRNNTFRRNYIHTIAVGIGQYHDCPGYLGGCSSGTQWIQNTVGGSALATGISYGCTQWNWGWSAIHPQDAAMQGNRTVTGNHHRTSGAGFTSATGYTQAPGGDGGAPMYFNGDNGAGSVVSGNWCDPGAAGSSVLFYCDNGTQHVTATGNVMGDGGTSSAFYAKFNAGNIAAANNTFDGSFAGSASSIAPGADPSNTVTNTTLASPFGATATEITRAAGAWAAHQ